MPAPSHIAIWAIAALTIAAILVRPFRVPEWCWAVAGAAALVASGLLPGASALHAAWDGMDVYLFLAGMLALSELARIEGLFDWLASRIVPAARGSTRLLFAWVYLAGIAITALLSNDGTILLLTPAVLAVVRGAGVTPLPFLFACAFVANAASFILPISNPANLVLFPTLPTLGPWFAAFGLPSLAAVALTYAALHMLFGRGLASGHESGVPQYALSPTGKLTAAVVAGSAGAILVCAAIGWPVGRAAFLLGGASLLVVALADSNSPRAVLRETPWTIVPLVAGLFVVVAALDRSGVLQLARDFFRYAGTLSPGSGKLLAGAAVAVADNALNNLPVGVILRYSVHAAAVAPFVSHAALIAVDLGPNLSLTGSLATLLWLITLRRENIEVTPLQFLKIGVVVTLPALAAALVAVR